MLDQRRRQWPRMKYKHVIFLHYTQQTLGVEANWANSEPTWLTMDQR